jgi:hypothetical protein
MSFLSATLLAVALVLPRQQESPRVPAPDFAAEYSALERDFGSAQDAYYAPYQNAKTDEERQRIRLDPNQEPTRLFLPRFQDLALRAKGTEGGARSLLWIVGNSPEENTAPARAAVDELLANYLDSPRLSELSQQLQYVAGRIGTSRAKEVLQKIGKDSPHGEVRASALFTLGTLLPQDKAGAAEAKTLFERVKKEYQGTIWAERAEATLFELEHLQIGMVAPDFEATDEKGASYKLSDYRGKVVVLDFWGFW